MRRQYTQSALSPVTATDNLLATLERIEDAIGDQSAFPEPVSLDAVISVISVPAFARDLRSKVHTTLALLLLT